MVDRHPASGHDTFGSPLSYHDTSLVASKLGGSSALSPVPGVAGPKRQVGHWAPTQLFAAGWWLAPLMLLLLLPRWFRRFGVDVTISLPITLVSGRVACLDLVGVVAGDRARLGAAPPPWLVQPRWNRSEPEDDRAGGRRSWSSSWRSVWPGWRWYTNRGLSPWAPLPRPDDWRLCCGSDGRACGQSGWWRSAGLGGESCCSNTSASTPVLSQPSRAPSIPDPGDSQGSCRPCAPTRRPPPLDSRNRAGRSSRRTSPNRRPATRCLVLRPCCCCRVSAGGAPEAHPHRLRRVGGGADPTGILVSLRVAHARNRLFPLSLVSPDRMAQVVGLRGHVDLWVVPLGPARRGTGASHGRPSVGVAVAVFFLSAVGGSAYRSEHLPTYRAVYVIGISLAAAVSLALAVAVRRWWALVPMVVAAVAVTATVFPWQHGFAGLRDGNAAATVEPWQSRSRRVPCGSRMTSTPTPCSWPATPYPHCPASNGSDQRNGLASAGPGRYPRGPVEPRRGVHRLCLGQTGVRCHHPAARRGLPSRQRGPVRSRARPTSRGSHRLEHPAAGAASTQHGSFQYGGGPRYIYQRTMS